MTPETVKIAIRRVDGSVAIMHFVTRGRGSILPYGATWEDKARGLWRREPSDANVFQEIGRQPTIDAVAYRRVGEADVPTDRTFRDAWEDDGASIRTNMPKARAIHLGRVRATRARALANLDAEWMRAQGQGKKTEAEAVEAKRQALRDLPITLGVDGARTPEELAVLWSPLLDEV